MTKLFKPIMALVTILVISVVAYNYVYSPVKAKPIKTPIILSSVPVDFIKDVKPVLAKRCVVCHACYDAPCQLKLGSFEGISRGANKERVYDGERLLEANLTRLFEDANTLEEWRDKAFFPVISDQASLNEAHENLASSVMAELLSLKQDNPLPQQKLLSEDFELDLNRQYQCPKVDEVAEYKNDYPLWGMPYGLPTLDKTEHDLLTQWIAQGGQGADTVEVDEKTLQKVEKWEEFFNRPDMKSRLMSRYLFEHLFLVNIHFEQDKPSQFFKLVRSATPPGTAIQGIYTRRPFDDPKVSRVYYRILPMKETVVHKSHMPIALNESRMKRWTDWFLTPDYVVDKLPSYLPEEASNPFISFAQIPVRSRYKYMLDESHNTIMQFIKGPVCRGQMALNVINDHFWVVFADPESDFVEHNNDFLQNALQNISLPAEKESTALPTSWLKYAAQEREYLKAKSAFIDKNMVDKVPVNLNLLWDGEGKNQNLALTVFRHNDAASVVKGLVGDNPQTAWVLTYPLFERIHYLLVAGYDVYGNFGHQLNSRMYMDFLRMEGEFNFLSLLPLEAQKKTRDFWYRGSVNSVKDFVYEANTSVVNTDIIYKTDNPLQELYGMVQSKVSDIQSSKHQLRNGFSSKEALNAFALINQFQGFGASILPESTIIQVINESSGKEHFYTLLRHSAHTNISHLFDENDRRLFDEDTLTIASGFLSSHPNVLMRVNESDLPAFAKQLRGLQKASDYTQLMDTYGVRRTNTKFWEFADNMHKYFQDNYPVEFGYLDFNRLENR
jgi:hypothetical protein